MTQNQLGDLIGVKGNCISRWEKSETYPDDWDQINSMSKVLNVPVLYLLGSNEVENNSNNIYIPILNEVQAGVFTQIEDIPPMDVEYYPVQRAYEHCFMLRVSGQSMEPRFHENDLLLVDPDLDYHSGDFVVALAENDTHATFKKYREKMDNEGPYCELVPLNEDFPTITSRFVKFRIVGVVIQHTQPTR